MQDVLVDIGLTWRVSPKVSEERASRTMARMIILRWEAIVRRLLEGISVRVVINNYYNACRAVASYMKTEERG